MSAATGQGLYQPGETLLHRLDPRVKVASCLLVVILAFSATSWAQIFTLILAVSVACRWISSLTSPVWRLCWMLRWFLLFTLLMHILFSPGRTLWGLSWLSYDGLLMGLFVCVQMLLAVSVSALLAITTSTNSLARAFGWFMQPLQWLGCRTEEWQRVLLLALDFIPVVQTEIRTISAAGGDADDEYVHSTIKNRWTVWAQKLRNLLFRLVEQGDEIAHRSVAGEGVSSLPPTLPPLLPMALLDLLFSLLITLLIGSCWLAG